MSEQPISPFSLPGALLGTVLASIFFGIVTVQTGVYFNRFADDPWGARLAVGTLWLVQAFHVPATTSMMYHYLIGSWKDPNILKSADWQWVAFVITSALSSFIVQCFFTARLWKFSKNKAVIGTILVIAFSQFGFGLAAAWEAALHPRFKVYAIHYVWIKDTWLALQAMCDLLIAAVGVYCLHKYRTGFQGTDRIIDKLIMWSINTGLVTSIVSLISLAIFTALKFQFVCMLLSISLGGLYTITLLSNLHARSTLRAMRSDSDGQRKSAVNLQPPSQPIIFINASKHTHATTQNSFTPTERRMLEIKMSTSDPGEWKASQGTSDISFSG